MYVGSGLFVVPLGTPLFNVLDKANAPTPTAKSPIIPKSSLAIVYKHSYSI